MAASRTTGKQVATIPAGAAGVSNGISLSPGERVIGLFTPTAWVAAVLEFEASLDGVTWVPVIDDAAAAVSIASATIVANRCIVAATILNKLTGLPRIRLASGPAAGRVNQTGGAIFGVVTGTV